MLKWTFITNHAAVLSLISRHPTITAPELALDVGISERAVRRIISELHGAGYISKKKEGRGLRYQIKPHAPLRHKTHNDKTVGDLLKVLNGQRYMKKIGMKRLGLIENGLRYDSASKLLVRRHASAMQKQGAFA